MVVRVCTLKAMSNGYQCSRSRPLDTPCPVVQHFAVFWLALGWLALAAKLLLQTVTKSHGRNYHRGRGGTCLLDFRQVLSKQTWRTVSVES